MSHRILVGILACGENEKSDAIAALKAQTYSDWDFFLIEDKPNKQAHEELYDRFAQSKLQYDLFLKLDADTVFIRTSALQEISDLFHATPDIVGAGIDLIDFYSNSLIPSLAVATGGVEWPRHTDNLLVDSYTRATGRILRVSDERKAVAVHSPNPSPLQAFRFGVHRALKAVQRDRTPQARFRHKANLQWKVLCKVWENFKIAQDRRLGLAIAGAEYVFSTEGSGCQFDYMHPLIADEFASRYQALTTPELLRTLSPQWNDLE